MTWSPKKTLTRTNTSDRGTRKNCRTTFQSLRSSPPGPAGEGGPPAGRLASDIVTSNGARQAVDRLRNVKIERTMSGVRLEPAMLRVAGVADRDAPDQMIEPEIDQRRGEQAHAPGG